MRQNDKITTEVRFQLSNQLITDKSQLPVGRCALEWLFQVEIESRADKHVENYMETVFDI